MALEAADRRLALGERRGQVLVEPVDAGDLLDQVDLADDVEVAVGGHRRLDLRVAADVEPEPLQVLLGIARAGPPCRAANRSGRGGRRPTAARSAAASTSIVPGTSRAPQSSTSSFEATACARIVRSGWSCFSNRVEASERRDSRFEVRRMFVPFQFADLEQHPRGRVGDLRDLPAHDPGDARGPLAVADEDRLGVELALDVVEGRHPLARRRRP